MMEYSGEDLRPCPARLSTLSLLGTSMWLGSFIQSVTGVILSNNSISWSH